MGSDEVESELREMLVSRCGNQGWELGTLLENPGSPRQVCLTLRDRTNFVGLMKSLRDDPKFKFNMLIDITAVDYLKFPKPMERFGVVYSLLSLEFNRRLWVKVMLEESDLHVESVCEIWGAAVWLEREVFDMFGIIFDHHPNLTRILSPGNFEYFPLRKDYPLTGMGERYNFPRLTREDA
jgi:NADH-quinone oxidoreductase subunit C